MPISFRLAGAVAAGLLAVATVHAQAVKAQTEHPAADNTATNARDRDTRATTPLDQGNDKDSLAVTAAIRRAVMDDSALSTSAHNVKIVTNGDTVTLRGAVANADERKRIESLAVKAAAGKQVRNEISIAE